MWRIRCNDGMKTIARSKMSGDSISKIHDMWHVHRKALNPKKHLRKNGDTLCPSSLGVLLQHFCIHNADLCSFTCYSFIVNLWFSFANRFLGSCWISLCVPWAVLLCQAGKQGTAWQGAVVFCVDGTKHPMWICFNINKSTHTHVNIYIYTLIPSS